ncbi:hypothetical protein KFY46_25700, partial [Salmonella enterica subsp. enterica serovar 1,4,[5],12:i:-]|nr:hypothetical protein [Salmonella enterica subsp. enterica serovar 1,4,[5],12:i:-]
MLLLFALVLLISRALVLLLVLRAILDEMAIAATLETLIATSRTKWLLRVLPRRLLLLQRWREARR